MKHSVKKIGIIIILLSLGVNLMSFELFSGIVYPDKVFSFTQTGNVPPSSADKRLNLGDKYPQALNIWMSQGGNSFKKSLLPTIFVNVPYKKLHIKEMSYTYDCENGIILSDKSFNIPGFKTQNGWYLAGGIGKPLCRVNFEKIFKGKEVGDTFNFSLKIVFSFDDEPLQTQILEYKVVTVKNRYVSPFNF